MWKSIDLFSRFAIIEFVGKRDTLFISFGSIAQLGERYLDKVEVGGSSPSGTIGCQTLRKTVGTRSSN